MQKLALVIDRADAPNEFNVYQLGTGLASVPKVLGLINDFWNTPTRLVDRAICETDTSTLQIIPYILLRDPVGRVFVYNRGKGSGEARLKGALSIGLGGHIDGVPGAFTLEHWCTLEAIRELQEEVGLKGTVDFIFSRIRFYGLLCDPTPGVGHVHLGVLGVIGVTPAQMGTAELDVIEGGAWVTLETLQTPEYYDRLEGWSKAAVDRAMRYGYASFT